MSTERPEIIHIDREPFDAKEYDERLPELVRFDTTTAINGLSLCSAMMLLRGDKSAVRINGSIGARIAVSGNKFIIGFTPTDEDMRDSLPLKVISNGGIWKPHPKQVVVVRRALPVIEGYFINKVDDRPQAPTALTERLSRVA